jgi:hypothetical protein
MSSYGDYNSATGFYMRFNLCFIFFQTPFDVKSKKEEINDNISTFMIITNAFLRNLSISFAGGDDKNDCYASAITSDEYIELVEANLQPVNLLYPMRLRMLAEFYYARYF